MIETADKDEVEALRAENPDEPVMLKALGASNWLLFRPGRDVPVRVPAGGHKARYADEKERTY